MKIYLLTNDKSKPNFFAEHGLSLYIKHPLYNILFDTGYTSVYLDNAKKMGLKLNDLDYIVISHGHYDHAGGLLYFPSAKKPNSIIVHRDAYTSKYAKEAKIRYNGIPFEKDDLKWAKTLYEEVTGFSEIAPGFFVIGDIKHEIDHDKYFVDDKLDDFHDEILMILEEDDGLSIFMGCSHFGVVNGINEVRKKFPNKKIKNLIAGMHLGSKRYDEIKLIAEELSKIEFDRVIPLHCTGKTAMDIFKERFNDRCIILEAGDSLEI